MTRWATFDCYGTLIDWNGGIRAELARVFGDDRADEQLDRYHELEPELEQDGSVQLPRGDDRGDAPARRTGRRGGRARRRRCRPGSRSPRRRPRSRRHATAGGSSRSSRTPTPTRSPRRRRCSGSRSTRRSLRARSAHTSRRPPLAGVLRAHPCRPGAARPRRRKPLPRHRSRRRARAPVDLDQPPGRACEPAPTRELADLSALADTLDELVPGP